MNRARHFSCWFRTAGIALALTFFQRCAEAQAIAADEALAWDSPKVRELEREWQEVEDVWAKAPEKIPGPTNRNHTQVESLQSKLIATRLSDRELQGLARAAGPIPNREFTKQVVECMVMTFLSTADRESLVTTLLKRCPDRVFFVPIEFRLARYGFQIKDPILILGEAYVECQYPETCRSLAAAVRRGFASLGIQGKDDADYVKNAMQWYEKEKHHLAFNLKYINNDQSVPLERYEEHPEYYDNYPGRVKREPLFEEKVSSRESPERDRQTEPDPGPNGIEEALPTTAEKELAKFQGAWEVVEITSNGARLSDERIKGVRFVFQNETLTETWPFLDNMRDTSHFHLDVQQHPLAIDLIQMPQWALAKEQTTPLLYELQKSTRLGIYAINGDSLWICLRGRRRPTSFKAEKDSGTELFLLRRVKE
jgi:uncharacterized protein (TIGR03067 family)